MKPPIYQKSLDAYLRGELQPLKRAPILREESCYEQEIPMYTSNNLQFTINSLRAVLADREAELLELKGPCSNKGCRLHREHRGPCDTVKYVY